jgi:hypothetical protein
MRCTKIVLVVAGAALAAGCSAGDPGPSVASVSATPAPTSEASAGATPAATPASAPAQAATPGNCATGQLAVTLGQGEGAAGSTYAPLLFRNTGTTECRMRGFPGVSYVTGDDGHQVGPAAAMSGERGGEIPLPPGASAAAQVKFANAANFDPGQCRPTPVRGLRVYPPGETASVFVPFETTGCAGDPLPADQLAVETMTAA